MQTVTITREVPDPLDMYNPWKEVEIEVEVEIPPGQPYPSGVEISRSHSLPAIETPEADDAAIAGEQ